MSDIRSADLHELFDDLVAQDRLGSAREVRKSSGSGWTVAGIERAQKLDPLVPPTSNGFTIPARPRGLQNERRTKWTRPNRR